MFSALKKNAVDPKISKFIKLVSFSYYFIEFTGFFESPKGYKKVGVTELVFE